MERYNIIRNYSSKRKLYNFNAIYNINTLWVKKEVYDYVRSLPLVRIHNLTDIECGSFLALKEYYDQSYNDISIYIPYLGKFYFYSMEDATRFKFEFLDFNKEKIRDFLPNYDRDRHGPLTLTL